MTPSNHDERIHSVDDLSPLDALKVGIAQCAALIPGTSRSGATIIGGMLFGLPRTVATEFLSSWLYQSSARQRCMNLSNFGNHQSPSHPTLALRL